MLEAAIERANQRLSPTLIRDGQAIQQQGGVLQVRLSEGLVKARVKGSTQQIFQVFYDLRAWPGKPSQCSCDVRKNCIHAVASLFALKQSRDTTGSASADIKPPEPSVVMGTFSQGLDMSQLEWYSSLEPIKAGAFGYELGVIVDGKTVSILPLLLGFLNQTKDVDLLNLPDTQPVTINHPDGKLRVTLGRLKPLLSFLLQQNRDIDPDDLRLPIKPFEQLMWAEIESDLHPMAKSKLAFKGYLDVLQSLADPESLPKVTPPKTFNTPLRDYQLQGLAWLDMLRQHDFGGILADDMGLGKTIQTLAFLMCEKEQKRATGPSLIVAPTSLLWNWYDEAKRFAPDLRCIVYHGLQRQRQDLLNCDVIISTYGVAQRDIERFETIPLYYLILDEAQLIKNAASKTTRMVRRIQSKHRLCLSGTPMENHLGELWSLFHFLMPGFLGTAKSFRSQYKAPIEKHQDEAALNQLLKRTCPFILRRTKQEVAKELPSKTETVLSIELTGKQRDLYELIRVSMEQKLRDILKSHGIAQSRVFFLDALLKLRQVACDPRILSMPEAVMAHGESAKLESLMSLLDTLIEEGRSILIFSQFTRMLKLIETCCIEKGYKYLKLTGKTVNRQALVDAFQAGEAPLFLISLKAGGKGLNLTQADTVIHYDPWWNPAVEAQATDRSHRIGQDRPVFVYKLIATGTVEEVVLNLQAKKQTLITKMLPGQGGLDLSFEEKDFDLFFSPEAHGS